MQGELSVEQGQLFLKPCDEQRRFRLIDAGAGDLAKEVDQLGGASGGPLFADLKGQLDADPHGGEGQFMASQIYRLQMEGHGCNDVNFPMLSVRASGNEPFWSLDVSPHGLVLTRPDHAPLALPYLEERLPEGRWHLSSEANDLRLSLWLTPQRCVDDMSGAVRHLSAELRLGEQRFTGCAYHGGAYEE
ncbi:hypothetical protein [Pseudomonas sp.]|uniref:COG3650 family protein n=1 Tax=Pseudomonas sp. TaxID=306 RepID=UPI0030810DD4